MSRKQQRVKRAAKRKEQTAERVALSAQINTVIRPFGCRLLGLGPPAVGVQGDARTYGYAVVVAFPRDATQDHVNEVSTQITNRVANVTRVLLDIPV